MVARYADALTRPGAARALFGMRPRPSLLALLVALAARGHAPARELARATLGSLLASGLRDPLEGAFHGAAAEPRWVVPAFERRLADQAAMIALLVDAAAALGPTGGDLVALAAAAADWALTHLVAADGRSAARGVAAASFPYDEASHLTWTVEALPDPALFAVAQRAFDVWDRGELASDPRKNVLYAAEAPARVAKELGLDVAEVEARLARARPLLLAARAARPQPPVDGPAPVAELATFASSLQRLAAAAAEPRWATAADALTAALAAHVSDDGAVPHLTIGAPTPGEHDLPWLADHAALGLRLVEAGALPPARAIVRRLLAHFDDGPRGLAATPALRLHPLEDGSLPSANAVAARLFDALGRADGDAALVARARALAADLAPQAAALGPRGAALLQLALTLGD